MKYLILYLVLMPGIIFGILLLFLGSTFPIWLISITSFGIVIFLAIILLTVQPGNKKSLLNLSSTLQKQKITTKMIFQRLAQLGVIVLILLFLFTPAGEEKEEEIEVEYLQMTNSGGQEIYCVAKTGNCRIEISDKDTEIHFSSVNKFYDEKKQFSFLVKKGEKYRTEIFFFKNSDLRNGDIYNKIQGPLSKSQQKGFKQSFVCSNRDNCSVILVIYLEKGGYIEIENMNLQTF